MPLQIVRNDITKMKVDAIVNAANSSLLGGGGVDGCIHRAAGPELLVECEKLNGCKTGSAKITKGYKLPCKYVIHAVGPRWYGGQYGEHDKLVSCYQTSLALAKEHGCESVAFPLISSGIFGYPKDEALKVAIDTISSFLLENDMMVYIVIFDRKAYQISSKLFADINAYIDDRYVEEHRDSYAERISRLHSLAAEESCPIPTAPMVTKAASLDDALKQIDESFSEMLLRKIDECGMTDAECYTTGKQPSSKSTLRNFRRSLCAKLYPWKSAGSCHSGNYRSEISNFSAAFGTGVFEISTAPEPTRFPH